MGELISSLRQGINTVHIVGTLEEINLKKYTYDDGRNYIRGDLVIGVSPNEKYKVNYWANEFTAKGEVSKTYKGLETVMEDYVSRASALLHNLPESEISLVETRANFAINDYVSKNSGEIVSEPQLKAMTVSRVNGEFNPCADFSAEIYVENIFDEVDENGNNTGRVAVDGVLPVYNGAVIPIKFFCATDSAYVNVGDYIKNNYSVGRSCVVRGKLKCTMESKTYVHESFGAPSSEKTFTKYMYENIIYDGDKEQYLITDPKSFDKSTIKAAMLYRAEQLESKKNSSLSTSFSNSSFASATSSFSPTPKSSTSTFAEDTDEEIDF